MQAQTVEKIDYSKYMRVSEILASLRNFSMIPENTLRDKGLIGTETHQNIYEFENGLFPDFSLYPLRDRDGLIKTDTNGNPLQAHRGRGYFQSYQTWAVKNKPTYIFHPDPADKDAGRLVDDDMMITGQSDALIILPEKDFQKPLLIDFKCSLKADLEIWAMQAHFYAYLMAKNNVDYHPTEFMWLQLHKDGKDPKEHWITFDERILAKCLQQALLFYEEKFQSKIVDFFEP